MSCGYASTHSSINRGGSASQNEKKIFQSVDPSDIDLTGCKGKVIVNVDTTNDHYYVMSVDFSGVEEGTEVVFRKITDDGNRIIDGYTNHVNRMYENVCICWDGDDYIVI